MSRFNRLLTNVLIVIALAFTSMQTYNISQNYNKSAINKTICLTFVSVNNANGAGSVIKSWKEKDKKYAYVLTAAHVVKPSPDKPVPDKVSGKFIINQSGGNFITDGTVEFFDPYKDICILKYELDYLSKTVVCDMRENDLLDKVYSAGMPNSMFWVTSGTIASTFSKDEGFISHNAPGFYGNSGGPLFNSSGHQIGVNLLMGQARGKKDVAIPSINYAISIKEIQHTLGKEKFNKYFGSVK